MVGYERSTLLPHRSQLNNNVYYVCIRIYICIYNCACICIVFICVMRYVYYLDT